MRERVVISSLEQLQEEKRLAKKQVEYGMRKLRNDMEDAVNYRRYFSVSSTNKYLSYLGYAFTAFKIATSVMGVVNMFRKKKR